MANFYIRFVKQNNQTQIEYLWERGRDKPKYALTVAEEVRDRRIVSILRKYLDMEFKSGQINVFDRRDFETLGELLFDLIFHDRNLHIEFGNWHSTVVEGYDTADSHNIFLEFEQEKEFDDLAILPWEYIYFNPMEKGQKLDEPFLAASPKSKINFYRKLPYQINDRFDKEKFEINMPLKILLVISNPNAELELKLLDELQQYFKELKERFDDDKLQIKYLYQPNHLEFRSELDSGQRNKSEFYTLDKLGEKIGKHNKTFNPDIVHLVGHGSVEGNNGVVIFTKEDKYTPDRFDPVSKNDEWFANSLKDSRLNPKLVFLQICNGARIVDYLHNTGTAISLLNNKIPFVIAMQNPVLESHALRFTQIFYDNFVEGKNIGECVTIGRYEIGTQRVFKEKAFGSPVLFTYLKFPIKVNIPTDKESKELVEEEETIKYCNNPGCPYYRDEERYLPSDITCTQGHLLVSKKKVTAQADFEISAGRTVLASPEVRYENKTTDFTSSPGNVDPIRELIQRNQGNDFKTRKPSNWNDQ